jgi:peptide/nickel transport system substrate-binding protein
VLALGAALCSTAHAATPLRISFTADIRSTEPGVNRDSNSDTVVMHIVEGLVAYGEDAEVRPMLAESVKISDDGTTYTFPLRDGVKFHNGETLTSADVLWTWKHYMDPKTAWRCLSEYDGRGPAHVVSVEAPDARTVVFKLDKPNGLFLSSLARIDCGGTGILNKASVKADGSWDTPISTGPFKLAEWRRGQYISLKKFADYANRGGKRDGYTGSKRPLVDEVRFVVVPDDSTAKTALQRGDIDIIEELSSSDVAVLEKVPGIKVAHAPVMGLTMLLMQTRSPQLSNLKLREAIAHAIDYKQLAAAVNEGMADANNSLVPSVSPYYSAVEKQGWDYDPALTKKLLKEADYKGQELTIIATRRYPQSYNAGVLIQSMLQSAGINAKLEVMEWGAQSDRYTTGKYQMIAHPFSPRLDPALSFDAVTGKKDEEPRKIWDSPKAFELITAASIETDHAKRQALFDQLHRLFIAEVPSIPLYNGADIGAFRANIKGYTPWAVKKPRAWEVEKTEN